MDIEFQMTQILLVLDVKHKIAKIALETKLMDFVILASQVTEESPLVTVQ